MADLSPRVAAELADGIYDVRSELLLPIFLARPEFSGTTGQKLSLKAEVGTRLN